MIIINIETLLKNFDKEKLNRLMSDPTFQERAKNVDIGKLLEEIKKNPDIINQFKKLI